MCSISHHMDEVPTMLTVHVKGIWGQVFLYCQALLLTGWFHDPHFILPLWCGGRVSHWIFLSSFVLLSQTSEGYKAPKVLELRLLVCSICRWYSGRAVDSWQSKFGLLYMFSILPRCANTLQCYILSIMNVFLSLKWDHHFLSTLWQLPCLFT